MVVASHLPHTSRWACVNPKVEGWDGNWRKCSVYVGAVSECCMHVLLEPLLPKTVCCIRPWNPFVSLVSVQLTQMNRLVRPTACSSATKNDLEDRNGLADRQQWLVVHLLTWALVEPRVRHDIGLCNEHRLSCATSPLVHASPVG